MLAVTNAAPPNGKTSIRQAIEDALVVAIYTGAAALGVGLVDMSLSVSDFKVTVIAAIVAGIVAYARDRQIKLKG